MTQPSQQKKQPLFSWRLCAVLLLALILRSWFVWHQMTQHKPLLFEMEDYRQMATNFLSGKGLETDDGYAAWRLPIYPLLQSGIMLVTRTEQAALLVLQVLLSVMTVLLVYILAKQVAAPLLDIHGQRFRGWCWLVGSDPDQINTASGSTPTDTFSTRLGLMAAGVCAIEESLIFYSGQLLPDTLYTTLLCLWLVLLTRPADKISWGAGFMIGIVAGVAALTNASFIFVLPAALIYLAYRQDYDVGLSSSAQPKPIPQGTMFRMMVGVVLVMSFWSLRNLSVFGTWVPLTTSTGLDLYQGYHTDFGYPHEKIEVEVRRVLLKVYPESLQNELLTALALRHAFRNLRRTVGQHAWMKIGHVFWAPQSGWDLFGVHPHAMSGGGYWLHPLQWGELSNLPYKPWPYFQNGRGVTFWKPAVENELPLHTDWFWREGRLPLLSWSLPVLLFVLIGILVAGFHGGSFGLLVSVLVCYICSKVFFYGEARDRTAIMPILMIFVGLVCLVVSDTILLVGRKFINRER